jgi:hypothetical protein
MRGVCDLDREVRLLVAVDIALDELADRSPESVQLTRNACERRVGADKSEGIVRSRSILRIGVDPRHVDFVNALLKILDCVARRPAGATVRNSAIDELVVARTAVQQVLAGATIQHVIAGFAEQPVIAGKAEQRIAAAAAVDEVGRGIAVDDVVATAGKWSKMSDEPLEREPNDRAGRADDGQSLPCAIRSDRGSGQDAIPDTSAGDLWR